MIRAAVSGFVSMVPVGKVEAVRHGYQVLGTAGGEFRPLQWGALSFHMTKVPGVKVQARAQVLGKDGACVRGSPERRGWRESLAQDKAAVRLDPLMGLFVLVVRERAEMEKPGGNLAFRRREGGPRGV